jgi:hypothetical protein
MIDGNQQTADSNQQTAVSFETKTFVLLLTADC